ncbi:sigma-70 family RNA polymerase sigma factor [Hymenobacter sp. HMF4947]|uniref:Sigma-70 family RNA polymerase sigma factor n=1 Tax=Hymenobacter ginkgonis TaxID=2682976 RepID=A0A7K1T9X2_9BACT|nr:sigma-70 family RNA polymerase sigma factor [Hymenobacter ginkgonis]MVN74971.1 sigma-70 family RNA polymerase sigma factor [Hymenobacter ginkgonis]
MPSPTPVQLTEMLAGCRGLDRPSQRQFYQEYYAFALSICLRYLHDRDTAVEAVNDGFLKVFQELPRFDTTRYPDLAGSLRGWLHRIMVRSAIDQFRATHRHAFHASLDEVEPTHAADGHTPLDTLSFDELLRLISELPPASRAVFNLHVIDGYSHEEIADQLHISVGTSKSNLFKARATLKNILKRNHHHAYAHYVR